MNAFDFGQDKTVCKLWAFDKNGQTFIYDKKVVKICYLSVM